MSVSRGSSPHSTSAENIQSAPPAVLYGMAEDIVTKNAQNSTIFDPSKEHKIPRFERDELILGKIIGRGGFCTVHEITSIRLNDSRRTSWGFGQSSKKGSNSQKKLPYPEANAVDRSFSGAEMPVREYMASTCNKGGSYVLKKVAEELAYQNKFTFLKGVVDLAMEAKFLSSLNHPNVSVIRGVSSQTPFGDSYFLVLDKLQETLPKRLKKWVTTDRQCKGITGTFVGGKKKEKALFTDRLCVAYSVANALHYLHTLHVIYRDLKPDNIGFDKNDNVRIFDFGLAKQLRRAEHVGDGFYRMTGFTGSIRYMSPEVGLKRPYNLKADVYSFSMLLWYILALEPPYGFYTPDMFVQRVFQGGHRPVVMNEWPKNLCILMKRCWDPRINTRPDFEKIMYAVKQEVAMIDSDRVAQMPQPYIPSMKIPMP